MQGVDPIRISLTLLVLLAIGLSQAAGQPPPGASGIAASDRAAAEMLPSGSFVSVGEDATGDPILVIDYPWKTHALPSIEVVALPDDKPDTSAIRPLYFLDKFMKGRTVKALYYCQDHAAEVSVHMTFAEAGIDFEVFGKRNSLARPAACIACSTQVLEIKAVVSRALFCSLDSWAVDRRTLFLDLPPDYFAKPGKLRVWFLRGNAVLWTETVTWPGIRE